MKIIVIGLRGIPEVQGGVETHAEHLYPLLVDLGCEVEVVVRTSSYPKHRPRSWKGIQLPRLWAPKSTSLEAIVHTFLAVLYAAFRRPDILHIHAIGPALMAPLARLLGLRVVVTHHGPDYDREKWGPFASWVLRTGERLGMKWANQRIVISQVIQQSINKKYGLDSELIPNGVTITDIPNSLSTLETFDLVPGNYVLQVSRLVPEKRQIDLVQAFIKADLPGWKLVLVGKLNLDELYTQKLLSETKGKDNIVLTDYQSGLPLQELFAHAGIFVLPSSHEGLPIALLEALSYGLTVNASDIPANLEIGLPTEQYFPLGDINRLAENLQDFGSIPLDSNKREQIRNWVKEKYNWPTIAKQTLTVYQSIV